MTPLFHGSFARVSVLVGSAALAVPGCASPQHRQGTHQEIAHRDGDDPMEAKRRLADHITEQSSVLIEETWCFVTDGARSDRFIAETPCNGIRDVNRNGRIDLFDDSFVIDCSRTTDVIPIPARRSDAWIVESYRYLYADCREETSLNQSDLVLLGLDPAGAVGESLEALFAKAQ